MADTPDGIEYCRDAGGTVPFDEWINGLKDVQGRAVVRIRLGRVFRGLMGECKSFGEGLFELKIRHGPG
jgi:putative addiction module killer protein